MKKILVLITLLIASTTNAQQNSGKYATAESYKKGEFIDTDEWTQNTSNGIEFKNKRGLYRVGFTSNMVKAYKLEPNEFIVWYPAEKMKLKDLIRIPAFWGYSSGIDVFRISNIGTNKGRNELLLIKDGAICVYGYFNEVDEREIDKDGNIIKLKASSQATDANFYISKSLTGDVIVLNKKNVAAMVQDDVELAAYVNSKKYSKKDLISVINSYNQSHKTK